MIVFDISNKKKIWSYVFFSREVISILVFQIAKIVIVHDDWQAIRTIASCQTNIGLGDAQVLWRSWSISFTA